jgi:exodeoxyribonuclease V beta subunit
MQSEEIDLKGWPEEDLLEMPESSTAEAARIEPEHRGVLLTSYTRMSRGKIWQAPSVDDDDSIAIYDEDVAGENVSEADLLLEGGLELPGGRETGTLLHTLLENTAADEIRGCSFEQWSSMPVVRQRVAVTVRQHGFSEEYLPAALQLVYNALRTPVFVQSCEKNATLKMDGGFAAGERQRMEMSFIYPIPENFHPLINRDIKNAVSQDGLPYKAVRGYLQGLVDLVFEHGGRVYILDWKSDRLPAFNEAALTSHVQANYRLQAQVYTLAVIRLLGITTEAQYEARFGGILYAFMRGIRLTGQKQEGIWYSLPPWSEVSAWEGNFVTCKEWGGEVIERYETSGAAGYEGGENNERFN